MKFDDSFYAEEVRNGYLITKQMKEVWGIQLQMLEKLLEVCRKYNLRIWAASGTLLGCVRDKGYIPWDDDIDMVMMREDYNKLLKIGGEEFTHPFFLQSAYSEEVPYPRGHAQLRMDGTAMVLPYDIHQKFHQGIFLDIFVFDAVPSEEKELALYLKEVQRVRTNIFRWYSMLKVTKYPFQMLRDLFFKYTHDFSTEFAKYESTISRYNIKEDSEIVKLCFLCTDEYVKSRKIPASLYEETEWLPFEYILMPVPKGYDGVLTKLYGKEYMKPRKAPSSHGVISALDVHKSYKDYLPLLKKKETKERWAKLFNLKKLLQ